ncbi:MAG TPA: RidA family protein [Xanthomonadaceae bacterium]|nr:RidA family protein [Xanthomonadaceae bacterium]
MLRYLLAVLLLPLLAVDARADRTGVEFHRSEDFAARGIPLSEAVRAGDLLLLSGQLGFVPGAGLAEGGIEAETRQTMDNIGAILGRHGLGFEHVVKCLVMLADIAEWPAFNKVYAGYFKESFPARSAFGGVQLVAGARVEVECMAAMPAGANPP